MPKSISIENKSRRIDGLPQIKFCDTFLSQLRGLMFRSRLAREEGLLLVGTRARPWRPAYFSRQPARYVLEVHPERWGDFEIGDRLQFKNA